MSLLEPNEGQRTIGPEPAGPAPGAVRDGQDTAVIADSQPTSEPKVFDEAYVKELRAENAKWRTQLRELESEFEGIDPEERRTLAEFARLSRAAESGDEQAAQQLAELLGVEGDEQPPAQAATPPTYDEAYFRRLAAEEAARIADERDQQRSAQEGVQQVISRAEALGYKHGSEDYILLMRAANSIDPNTLEDPSTLLVEGDKLVKAYKQQIVEEYLAGKGTRADTSLAVPTGGSAPAHQVEPPKGWADARERLHERLANIRQ